MRKLFVSLIILMIFTFTNCSEGTKDASKNENNEAAEVVTPTPDSLLDEILVEMGGFIKAMNSVIDVPSAENAVVEIKQRTDATLRLAKEMEKLPVPSESEKKQLAETWGGFEQGIRKMPGPDHGKMTDPQDVKRIMRAGMQSVGKTLDDADAILRRYGIQIVHSK